MVPVFMVVMLLPVFTDWSSLTDSILALVGAALFIGAAVTDLLDGKIARREGLVTDFGKFLDPLADKFMVIGAMLCIFFANSSAGNKSISTIYFFALIIVIFRELAVTSVRLIASSSRGVVIAANILGKLKTVLQIVAISAVIIEPVLFRSIEYFAPVPAILYQFPPVTVISAVLMVYFTIHSGINYIKGAWKYLDHNK
jgi:CDP-diacylglycerol--glycerol-3-phosphate 3-phosphatidyltransferase